MAASRPSSEPAVPAAAASGTDWWLLWRNSMPRPFQVLLPAEPGKLPLLTTSEKVVQLGPPVKLPPEHIGLSFADLARLYPPPAPRDEP